MRLPSCKIVSTKEIEALLEAYVSAASSSRLSGKITEADADIFSACLDQDREALQSQIDALLPSVQGRPVYLAVVGGGGVDFKEEDRGSALVLNTERSGDQAFLPPPYLRLLFSPSLSRAFPAHILDAKGGISQRDGKTYIVDRAAHLVMPARRAAAYEALNMAADRQISVVHYLSWDEPARVAEMAAAGYETRAVLCINPRRRLNDAEAATLRDYFTEAQSLSLRHPGDSPGAWAEVVRYDGPRLLQGNAGSGQEGLSEELHNARVSAQRMGVGHLIVTLDGLLLDTAWTLAKKAKNLAESDLVIEKTENGLSLRREPRATFPIAAEDVFLYDAGCSTRDLFARAAARANATPNSTKFNNLCKAYDEEREVLHASAKKYLRPGVPQVLQSLADAGWTFSLCANVPSGESKKALAAAGLSSLFGARVYGPDSALGASHALPAMVDLACKKAGFTPEDSCMAGCSRADMAAAQALGVPMVFYLDPVYDADGEDSLSERAQSILNAGAARVVRSIEDLPAAIRGSRSRPLPVSSAARPQGPRPSSPGSSSSLPRATV